MTDDYEVGYGKPPKERRFTKGQSGNPKGRPKGSKNRQTIMAQISRKPVTLTENGKTRVVTAKEGVFLQMQTGALKGDHRCRRDYLHELRLAEDAELSGQVVRTSQEADTAVFNSVLNRMKKMVRGDAPNATAAKPKEDK